MAKKKDSCCAPAQGLEACCKIESVVTVDERGQMVLPKEVRDKAGIKAGDKMAVVLFEKGGSVCCISLIKVASLAGMVREMLGPVMAEVMQENKEATK